MIERRPEGVSDETVEAVGSSSEAAEYLVRARGALYEFHQLMGHSDLLLGEAGEALAQAGHEEVAARLRAEVIGRNAIDGRWSFQIVEEFDDLYYEPVIRHLRAIEEQLLDGRRHVYESEMKERRRTAGRAGHEARPPAAWSDAVEAIPPTDDATT